MDQDFDKFYLTKDEPNKSCLLALRSIILKQNSLVSETRKYGMPCFCYKKKAFCYLWTDKNSQEPYILMVEGALLLHPALEQGSRAKMKILRVKPNEDIDVDLVKGILNDGLELYRSGAIKVK